jgi:hypothetical protein
VDPVDPDPDSDPQHCFSASFVPSLFFELMAFLVLYAYFKLTFIFICLDVKGSLGGQEPKEKSGADESANDKNNPVDDKQLKRKGGSKKNKQKKKKPRQKKKQLKSDNAENV